MSNPTFSAQVRGLTEEQLNRLYAFLDGAGVDVLDSDRLLVEQETDENEDEE